MLEASDIRYAESGDVSIAYRTAGEGPPDILLAPGFVSHCEELWSSRYLGGPQRQAATFGRLILYDKREQGLSDRIGRPPTVEEMRDDALAVLDATGAERPVVFGVSEGGAAAILLAATYPERCSHLVLWGAYARMTEAPGYPQGLPEETLDRFADQIRRDWGGPVGIQGFAPSWIGNAEAEGDWARLLRLGTSPAGAGALMALYKDLDVREALPLISAPTLVMHRSDDVIVPVALGRYLADNIPGARSVEFPGVDHLVAARDDDAILGEVQEFVTGTRAARGAERVLSTVLFTDIVDSTAHAAELGDRAWRDLLDRHDDLVQRQIERHQGRAVKSTGDGFLATFDGPARAIRCASAVASAVRQLGIDVRAGLHSGECELRNGDVGGMAVHIGARVAARAGSGEVLVSGTVKDLVVGSGIEFEDRGSTELKGVPGEWRLFAVSGPV